MDNMKKVDLLTINGGAAVEMFNEEFEKVMKNIADVSIASNEPREIKLSFKIKPSKDRQSAAVQLKCVSKLASIDPHESAMYLSHNQKGQIEAHVSCVKQGILFENPTQEG